MSRWRRMPPSASRPIQHRRSGNDGRLPSDRGAPGSQGRTRRHSNRPGKRSLPPGAAARIPSRCRASSSIITSPIQQRRKELPLPAGTFAESTARYQQRRACSTILRSSFTTMTLGKLALVEAGSLAQSRRRAGRIVARATRIVAGDRRRAVGCISNFRGEDSTFAAPRKRPDGRAREHRHIGA